jgi:hypothetical protein
VDAGGALGEGPGTEGAALSKSTPLCNHTCRRCISSTRCDGANIEPLNYYSFSLYLCGVRAVQLCCDTMPHVYEITKH